MSRCDKTKKKCQKNQANTFFAVKEFDRRINVAGIFTDSKRNKQNLAHQQREIRKLTLYAH